MKPFFAHVNPKAPEGAALHLLEDHLEATGRMAAGFAHASWADWAQWAGRWHDLGKYAAEFQNYLSAASGYDPNAHLEDSPKKGRVDHSTAGAQHAVSRLGNIGKPLAYVIAGHHAGLPDGVGPDRATLKARLHKQIFDWSAAPAPFCDGPRSLATPASLDGRRPFSLAFFIRMLFSTLVDADFLDTESFFEPQRPELRAGYPALPTLQTRLNEHLRDLTPDPPLGGINLLRGKILAACREAALLPPGFLSLTVPTGGGKTLSSLAFALDHCLHHGKRRIVYAIPYTSIIEQNAAVFKRALGEEAVLEHHSNFEPKTEDYRSRLAAENWDAPVIVTSNVQLFESLFANRPSRCRKLHRLQNSVIILDEAQMLPAELLLPCLAALKELVLGYGATVVLCTATQPALAERANFNGLSNIREIMRDPDPAELARELKRVRFVDRSDSPMAWVDLADDLRRRDQVLCIVNQRNHAAQLFSLLAGEPGAVHLSGLMCPAHRLEKITELRARLQKGEPCRVVSTHLIEAGVDLDFPVVYRAMAGLDSMIQAAGRCNREGRLVEPGTVFLFAPEGVHVPHFLKAKLQATRAALAQGHEADSLAAVEAYFREFFWQKGDQLDHHKLMQALTETAAQCDFAFRHVARVFRFIDSDYETVIVPYNRRAESCIDALTAAEGDRAPLRKLQPFTVQIPKTEYQSLLNHGGIRLIREAYAVLARPDLYDSQLGLRVEDSAFYRPENLFY